MMAQPPFFPVKPVDRFVKDPQPKDVLMGRGVVKNSLYTGNAMFLSFVNERKSEYRDSCREKKRLIAQAVLEKVQQTGGRFLKPIQIKRRDGHTDSWCEVVSTKEALAKCMQALRDPARPIVSPPTKEERKVKEVRQDHDDEGADPSELHSDSRDKSIGASNSGDADLLLFLKHNPTDFRRPEPTSNEIPAISQPTAHSGTIQSTTKDSPLEPPAQSMPSQQSVKLQAKNLAAQDLQRPQTVQQPKPIPLLNVASPQPPIMLGLHASGMVAPDLLQRPPPPHLVPSPHLVIPLAVTAQGNPPPPQLVTPAVAGQGKPPSPHLVAPLAGTAQDGPPPPHFVIPPAVAAQARANRLPFPPNVPQRVPPMQPTQQQPMRNMHISKSTVVDKVLARRRQQVPTSPPENHNCRIAAPKKTSTIRAITKRGNNTRNIILAMLEEKNKQMSLKATIKRASDDDDDTALPRRQGKRARVGC